MISIRIYLFKYFSENNFHPEVHFDQKLPQDFEVAWHRLVAHFGQNYLSLSLFYPKISLLTKREKLKKIKASGKQRLFFQFFELEKLLIRYTYFYKFHILL